MYQLSQLNVNRLQKKKTNSLQNIINTSYFKPVTILRTDMKNMSSKRLSCKNPSHEYVFEYLRSSLKDISPRKQMKDSAN